VKAIQNDEEFRGQLKSFFKLNALGISKIENAIQDIYKVQSKSRSSFESEILKLTTNLDNYSRKSDCINVQIK